MRYLKNLAFFTALFVAFLGTASAAPSVFRTNGADNGCPGQNEKSVFPYGLFCGSDGDNHAPIKIDHTNSGAKDVGGSTAETDYYTLPYGTSSVNFKLQYTTQGPAKLSQSDGSDPDLLVWATIDYSGNNYVKGVSSSNGSASLPCPSPNGTHPGVVYAQSSYNGDSPYPTDKDQSPYGYDGASGQVNCGDDGGSMVYWTNQHAPTGSGGGTATGYQFSVSLNATQSNDYFCVRGDISVYYPGAQSVFPAPGTSYKNDNSVASHLARNSKRSCYNVGFKPADQPDPTINGTNTCQKYRVDIPAHTIYKIRMFPKNIDYAGADRPYGVGYVAGPNEVAFDKASAWSKLNNALPAGTPGIQRTDDLTNSGSSTSVRINNLPTQTAGPDWIVYYESWYHFPSGSKDAKGKDISQFWQYNGLISSVDTNCYSAKCYQLNLSGATGPGGRFAVGDNINVQFVMQNTGKNTIATDTVPGASLGTTTSGPTQRPVQSGYSLGSGELGYSNFTVGTNGSSPGSYTIDPYPDYYGKFALGSGCTTTVSTYQKFDVSVAANLSFTGTSENPSKVNGNSSVTVSGTNLSVDLPFVYSRFYKVSPDVNYVNTAGKTYQGNGVARGVIADSRTPTEVSAGARYCIDINAPYTTGYVGPGGSSDVVVTNGAIVSAQDCGAIHNEPYVHFFGAPIAAGGCFGTTCSNEGDILTYTNPGGDARASGSGAQFGASASGFIKGLKTASLRNSGDPVGPSGATLSNFYPGLNIASINTTNAIYGGKSGLSRSVPDYYGEKSDSVSTDITSNNFTFSSASSEVRSFKPPTGTLTLNSDGPKQAGKKETIYVDGNVYIDKNITFASTGNYGTVNDIPSILIVAKGNIYVAPGVTQLDGIFVAQPSGTEPSQTKGIITTCAKADTTGATFFSPNELYNNCNNQLVINGSFVARKILLDRSYSSLRASSPGEYAASGNNKPCADGASNSPQNDCAAEIFKYSPETLLAQPTGVTPKGGPSTYDVDYITSLAPVL